jgi:hypothetical protein
VYASSFNAFNCNLSGSAGTSESSDHGLAMTDEEDDARVKHVHLPHLVPQHPRFAPLNSGCPCCCFVKSERYLVFCNHEEEENRCPDQNTTLHPVRPTTLCRARRFEAVAYLRRFSQMKPTFWHDRRHKSLVPVNTISARCILKGPSIPIMVFTVSNTPTACRWHVHAGVSFYAWFNVSCSQLR